MSFLALSARESSLVQTFCESCVHLDITHQSVHMARRFVIQGCPTLKFCLILVITVCSGAVSTHTMHLSECCTKQPQPYVRCTDCVCIILHCWTAWVWPSMVTCIPPPMPSLPASIYTFHLPNCKLAAYASFVAVCGMFAASIHSSVSSSSIQYQYSKFHSWSTIRNT